LAAEEDALRAIKELRELSTLIKRTQAELILIEEALKHLEKGEQIKSESLNRLGLTGQLSTVLKLRLKRMLSSRKTMLSEYKSKQRSDQELLNNLLKCPACGGLGSKVTTSYNRSDGKVAPMLKVEPCGICGGTGRATISARVLEMIREI